jgi:hypothetical protein
MGRHYRSHPAVIRLVTPTVATRLGYGNLPELFGEACDISDLALSFLLPSLDPVS